MNDLLDILNFILPSLVVLVFAFGLMRIVINKFIKLDQKKEAEKCDKAYQPLQYQAYERVTLFLERIIPANLIHRVYKQGMNSRQLYSELLRSVREEYEHNMSQQLYIKPETWELVKNAKESVIRILNESYGLNKDDGGSDQLSGMILEKYLEQKNNIVEEALLRLKQDIQK